MKHHLLIISALLLSPLGELRPAYAAPFAPESGSQFETKKHLPWKFTPDPALPNVLILGDSISIGYTLQLRELMKGKANVFRPIKADGSAAVNCEGTTAGLKRVDYWLGRQKWAVIYFNWGLHDLKHVKAPGGAPSNNPETPLEASVEDYRRNLEALVGKLRATGARLVFATTTPVAPNTLNPLREPDTPPRYNEAAKAIMKNHHIRISDLFAVCAPRLAEIQQPKNVHFNNAGYDFLAAQVAAVIMQELAAEK